MKHIAKLPFGYTVEFNISDSTASEISEQGGGAYRMDVFWLPHVPFDDKRLKKPERLEKFMSAYRKARHVFQQDVANSTGVVLMSAETPGSELCPGQPPYAVRPNSGPKAAH